MEALEFGGRGVDSLWIRHQDGVHEGIGLFLCHKSKLHHRVLYLAAMVRRVLGDFDAGRRKIVTARSTSEKDSKRHL